MATHVLAEKAGIKPARYVFELVAREVDLFSSSTSRTSASDKLLKLLPLLLNLPPRSRVLVQLLVRAGLDRQSVCDLVLTQRRLRHPADTRVGGLLISVHLRVFSVQPLQRPPVRGESCDEEVLHSVFEDLYLLLLSC